MEEKREDRETSGDPAECENVLRCFLRDRQTHGEAEDDQGHATKNDPHQGAGLGVFVAGFHLSFLRR